MATDKNLRFHPSSETMKSELHQINFAPFFSYSGFFGESSLSNLTINCLLIINDVIAFCSMYFSTKTWSVGPLEPSQLGRGTMFQWLQDQK